MSHNLPPGLIYIRDLIQRFPDEQTGLLAYEIRRRERDLLLYKSVRSVTHFQLWSALRSALVTGAAFFLLVVGAAQVVKFAQWVSDLQQTKVPIAAPLIKGVNLDIGSYIPSSTFITYAAKLPAWDWKDAGMLAIGLIAVILAIRMVTGWLVWRRSRSLLAAMDDIQDELSTLRAWLR